MNDLLVEKYRPRKVSDCVLPKGLSETFSDIVSTGDIPNMILCGGAGCGKTTVARAVCDELGRDVLFINASEDGGIDTLRNFIKHRGWLKPRIGWNRRYTPVNFIFRLIFPSLVGIHRIWKLLIDVFHFVHADQSARHGWHVIERWLTKSTTHLPY